MKEIVILLASVCILLSTGGCSNEKTYGPYCGKVVNAETKAPIEGAAILVVFYSSEPSTAGSTSRYADAFETFTDKNGEFRIPEHKVAR